MARDDLLLLFLCGDVMTGRGLDQALPFHCAPGLYEPFLKDAREYLSLAEDAQGPFRRPLGFAEIWGDALGELERRSPDLRLINLETSITASGQAWEGKGVHYRMHPENAPCLTAAGIQCCSLANNHVLDWGYEGLRETLATLARAGVKAVGAGEDASQAQAPAIFDVGRGRRVLVFGLGALTSGIPFEWQAGSAWPGVWLLPDLSLETAAEVGAHIRSHRRAGDLVIVSIHWGPNWGFEVGADERKFAHALVDAGADLIHGHSSHHVRGIEVYRRRLILYGCGDFLDDYEGISGHEAFRGDLGLMYFAALRTDGELAELELVPTTVRHFRVVRADAEGARWLRDALNAQDRLGTGAELGADGRLKLVWADSEGGWACATGTSSSFSEGR